MSRIENIRKKGKKKAKLSLGLRAGWVLKHLFLLSAETLSLLL